SASTFSIFPSSTFSPFRLLSRTVSSSSSITFTNTLLRRCTFATDTTLFLPSLDTASRSVKNPSTASPILRARNGARLHEVRHVFRQELLNPKPFGHSQSRCAYARRSGRG